LTFRTRKPEIWPSSDDLVCVITMKPEREFAIQHGFANVGDVRLHYAECGTGDDLVILLHGFPECWYSWRHQLPVLGQRYHVIAPDMRGYNLSDKPARVQDYRIEFLVEDVVGLIRYFGKDKAAIVAHDWGAGVAWALAQRHPELVSRLVAMQVPPPAAWRANFTLRQLRRSWYMFFFQLPRLPESWARANDFARIAKMYRETSVRSDAFTDEDIEAYKEALRQPGALTAPGSITIGRTSLSRYSVAELRHPEKTMAAFGSRRCLSTASRIKPFCLRLCAALTGSSTLRIVNLEFPTVRIGCRMRPSRK